MNTVKNPKGKHRRLWASIWSSIIQYNFRLQPRSCFFEDAVLKDKVGHHFLEGQRLGTQVLDLRAACLARRITCQALLSRLEKLLGPAIIQALGDTLSPAQLCDTVFAAKAGQDNADLLFRAMNLTGCAADVFDDLLGLGFLRHGFLAHLRSMKATMSQKPSVPQYAETVPRVL